MKKKLLVLSMIIAMGVSSFVGCGAGASSESSANNIEANTPATKLQVQFLDEVASTDDIEVIAEKLCQNSEVADISMATLPVEEGFLNGFDGDVKGFKNGVMFAPMIGTIPFVGYIFETDDVDGLKATLEQQAMLNWNICTVADEMVIDSVDNIVFFVMAPNSFDE